MSVTPEEIAVAMGVTAPEPESIMWQQWSLWIDDANMLIEARADRLNVDRSKIDEAKIDYVVREAVVAHVKRPDDVTQVSVQVDDGMTNKSYRSGKGRVSILDEWWALLGLVESGVAFAVDMISQGGGLHPPFCSIYFGGECSCGIAAVGAQIYEPGWV